MILRFEISLADHDRGLSRELSFRAVRHPSESDAFLATRILAYALEFEDEITFPPGGLSARDVPALWRLGAAGRPELWVEVGSPSPKRLRKALSRADRVVVYDHRGKRGARRPTLDRASLRDPERLTTVSVEAAFAEALGASFGRRNLLKISRREAVVRVEVGELVLESVLEATS